MEKNNIMKIAKIIKQNRSKKGKNILDVYIRFYTKPKPTENRLKGMFLYRKPQNAIQTNHNKNINYEIEQHINQLVRDQRLGILDIEDYNAPTENIRKWAENWLQTKDFDENTQSPYKVVLDLFDEYFGKGKTL